MKTSHEFSRIIEVQIGQKIVTTIIRFKSYIDDITYVEEKLDDKGKSYANACVIHHKDRGEMLVLGEYQELSHIVFREKNEKGPVGFIVEAQPNKDESIRPKRRKSDSKRGGSGNSRVRRTVQKGQNTGKSDSAS